MTRRFTLILAFALQALSQIPDWRNGVTQISTSAKSPGTGFIVAIRSGRAYILTCAHVIAGSPHPQVRFHADPEKRPYQADVLNLDIRTDLALLTVDKPPADLAIIEPRFDDVPVQTSIVVAGFPGEAEGRFLELEGRTSAPPGTDLQFTPPTEEGFSGGPVLTEKKVIGVVFEHTKSFGRAIPAVIVDRFLRGQQVQWGSDSNRIAAGTLRLNPKDGLKYVWIPPGTFTMGCSQGDSECYFAAEAPSHEVTLTKGFWMGQTEVPQAAYERVMKTNPSMFKGADRPVERVLWKDALAYCQAAGGRLPTEAEWEYAARAGNRDPRHGALDRIAWYQANSNGETHPVGQKEANAWGLYDMLGNVLEWVSDFPGPYASATVVDPQGAPAWQSHSLRGGAWNYVPFAERASARLFYEPTVWEDSIGFRCVADIR